MRQAQLSADFELLDWTVQPISHEKIIGTTGGLFEFNGAGRDAQGTRPWAVALKILNNPKEWGQEPRHWAYWKREMLTFQSGMLDALPAGLSAPRRNLMLRTNAQGQEELVALDWAFRGPGALGMDVGELVGSSALHFEAEPAEASALEVATLKGYAAGLRDAGWSGDPRTARLGYLLSAVLRMGATLPGWVADMLSEGSGVNVRAMYGRPAQAVLAGWVTLNEYLLERAAEARRLMADLDLA